MSLCRVAADSPYINLMVLYLHFPVLLDSRIFNLFESRVALQPGARGVKDVASASALINKLNKPSLLFSSFGDLLIR